jgi:acetolactate synthase-1/2/3 large subunit
MAGTPLVLISGCVGINMIEKLDLQDMRQAPVIEPMVKKAFICHAAERVPEFIDLAFREAVSGRPGPVYLELPVDVLGAEPSREVELPVTRAESGVVDRDKARELLRWLAESEKPMLIAGSGAWYSDAGEELTRFIEATGVPIFTAANGRGVVSDTHPLCFEGALAIRPGSGMHAGMNADLVLVLGNRLNLFCLFGNTYNPQARMVQVDIKPEEIGRNRKIDLPIMSDIRALAAELNELVEREGLGGGLRERFAPWTEELRRAHAEGKANAEANWRSEAVPIHPMRIAYDVNEYMDREDDIVVTDGGDATTWIGMSRTMRCAGHYLDYGLFGSLGGGIPYANTAKFLFPGHYLDYGLFGSLGGGIPYANTAKFLFPEKRVLLFTGDGSIGFNFMEFERAITKGISFVVVIANDLGWGMIRHSQEVRLGRAIEGVTELGRIDYHRFVESMGGVGFLVEKPEEIRPALDEAFASGKVACINVMSDPTAVSPGSIALANVGAYK